MAARRKSEDPGSLVEPNRHLRSLEEPRQVLGLLRDLLPRRSVKVRKHRDVDAKLLRAAVIGPSPGDTTVHEDDRSEPPLVLVHPLVVGSVDQVVSVAVAQQEWVEAREEPHASAVHLGLFHVREVLSQEKSGAAATVYLDNLVPEPVQDYSEPSNVHAGPSPK